MNKSSANYLGRAFLIWLAIATAAGCSIQGEVTVTGSSIDRSTSLYFRTEPPTQIAGQTFTTSPVVEIRDDQGGSCHKFIESRNDKHEQWLRKLSWNRLCSCYKWGGDL